MVTWLRQGSSEIRLVGVRSKFFPTATGDHRFFCAPMVVAPAEPCTSSMADSRTLPVAAFASAVPEGTIASRKGNAIVTPMPRRTVRRERCFFARYIIVSSNHRRAVVSTSLALVIRNA